MIPRWFLSRGRWWRHHGRAGVVWGIHRSRVAEGVEDETTVEMHEALGRDSVQGFNSARPLAPGDFAACMARAQTISSPREHSHTRTATVQVS